MESVTSAAPHGSRTLAETPRATRVGSPPAPERLDHAPDTRERVRRFIAETFFVDRFGDDESFLRSGIIDSLGMMNLVAFLEHDLGVRVEDVELLPENLDSVSKVVAFIERKRGANGAA